MMLINQDGRTIVTRFEPSDTLLDIAAYMHVNVNELIILLETVKRDTDRVKVICTSNYQCEVVSE